MNINPYFPPTLFLFFSLKNHVHTCVHDSGNTSRHVSQGAALEHVHHSNLKKVFLPAVVLDEADAAGGSYVAVRVHEAVVLRV
jgi:hypothetical protein